MLEQFKKVIPILFDDINRWDVLTIQLLTDFVWKTFISCIGSNAQRWATSGYTLFSFFPMKLSDGFGRFQLPNLKKHFYHIAPKCVDKKDAQQKHRMKMRCFRVNAKKSRKYSSKSLKVKNPTPFFQNNETGDAKSPFFSIRWVELPATPRSVFHKGKQPSVVRRNLSGEPQRAIFHFPPLLHLLRLSLIPWW